MLAQTALALQYLIVAIAVAVSTWVVLRRQAPNAERRLRISLALPLVRDGRPAWLRAIGRRIAPPVHTAEPGCGGCNGCETTDAHL
jgi:hypothetical protein